MRIRQLDEAGRRGAAAMGEAIRALRIPIGAVLTSPTYRALETVKHAGVGAPTVVEELGDRAPRDTPTEPFEGVSRLGADRC